MNEEIITRLNRVEEWIARKEKQQLSYPLDEVSKNVVSDGSGIVSRGNGSHATTQSIVIASTPATIDVPAAYAGTVKLLIGGVVREIPYL